jgi:hypothetical protein
VLQASQMVVPEAFVVADPLAHGGEAFGDEAVAVFAGPAVGRACYRATMWICRPSAVMTLKRVPKLGLRSPDSVL